MLRSRPKDYVAEGWLLLGGAGVVVGVVVLLTTSLLWTVPVPKLVAVAALLAAAAPTLVYARRRRGREWLVPVVAALVAVIGGIVVADNYEPPGSALHEMIDTTPLATWPGAGHPTTFDGCRYYCMMSGPTGSSVRLEVTVDHVQGSCLRMADQLLAAGWARHPSESYTDRCSVELTKPAHLGRTYVLSLSAEPDNLSLTVDVTDGPALPGRVVATLRAVAT